MLLAGLILSVNIAFAQVPYTFQNGQPANADHVNGNFIQLDTRINTLNQQTFELDATTDALSHRIDTEKQRIDTADQNISTLQTANTSNTSRIQNLETNQGSLQDRMNNLNSSKRGLYTPNPRCGGSGLTLSSTCTFTRYLCINIMNNTCDESADDFIYEECSQPSYARPRQCDGSWGSCQPIDTSPITCTNTLLGYLVFPN